MASDYFVGHIDFVNNGYLFDPLDFDHFEQPVKFEKFSIIGKIEKWFKSNKDKNLVVHKIIWSTNKEKSEVTTV